MDTNQHKPLSEQLPPPNRVAVTAAWIVLATPVILIYWGVLIWLGPWSVLVVMLIVPLVAFLCLLPFLPFVWAWCLTRAPELTKTATLIGVLGVVLLGLMTCWVLQAREAARRNQSGNNLRELGTKMGETSQFHPGDPHRRRHR
jgi:hypothetical protein